MPKGRHGFALVVPAASPTPWCPIGGAPGLAELEIPGIFKAMIEFLLVAAVSLVVIAPLWKERRSVRRIEELRSGAPEAYFEERRSLEAYPPKGSRLPRLAGAFLVLYYAINLVMRHSP